MAVSDNIKVYPGEDSATPAKRMQAGVASEISKLEGRSVDPDTLVPAQQQSPATAELKNFMQPPSPQLDFEDILEGERGHPRTEPSKNFLRTLIGKLRKKNPKKEITLEQK